jgi:hypothetical protein
MTTGAVPEEPPAGERPPAGPPAATTGTATAPMSPQPSLPFPLQAGEQVIMLCRRHWLYLIRSLFGLVVFALLPVIILAWLLSWADADGTVAQIFWIGAAVWLVYWGVRIFLTWYRYNHDTWAITNQRIVDSGKNHPFSLRVSSADLVNIQDLSVNRHGILATSFDYGDINCQTASSTEKFSLAGIPHPREVQALIDRERDRERKANR